MKPPSHQIRYANIVLRILITLTFILGIVDTKVAMAAPNVTITGILDGTLPGGTPKVIELYITDTVDLSGYTLERSSNGGPFDASTPLSGVYTNEFVYLMTDSNVDEFITVFGSSGDYANRITLGNVSHNGNDAYRILNGTSTVIDQVWHENATLSYEDSYWYRNSGTGPDGGWTATNWTAGGNGALDGMTAEQIRATVPFGNYVGPTAVRLASFAATPTENGIDITWETATEIDNLGFNLYRSTAPDGPFDQLNDTLILTRHPGQVLGAMYTWLDESAASGGVYYYRLEDVDIHGTATPHGPVSASLKSPTALSLTNLAARGGALSALASIAVAGGLSIGPRKRRRK